MSIYNITFHYYPQDSTCENHEDSIYMSIDYKVTGNEEQGLFLEIVREEYLSWKIGGQTYTLNGVVLDCIAEIINWDDINKLCWEDYNKRRGNGQ